MSGFEKELTELEGMVARLESGTLSIDESLEVFNSAIVLAKNCIRGINESKGKLELLTKELKRIDLDGEIDG